MDGCGLKKICFIYRYYHPYLHKFRFVAQFLYSNYTIKYHKTCEQFYRNFGIYEKSPNSFLPGLPHSIVNQFDFHNFLCLCLASVHLPYQLSYVHPAILHARFFL